MEFLEEKFVIVGVVGSGISLMGMILSITAIIVLSRLLIRSPSLIYLMTLSFFDFVFMCEYVMLLSSQIYFDYFKSLSLYQWWNKTLRLNHTIAKIVQTSSTYLIIVASVERFADAGGFFHLQKYHRLLIITFVIVSSVALRIISFWELKITTHDECKGFAQLSVSVSEVSKAKIFNIYNFYVIHIMTVFLPFLLLLLLNVGIVYTIRKSLKRRKPVLRPNFIWKSPDRDKNLASATRMLVSVITTYLASNTLSFSITLMEHTNRDLLESNLSFYTFSVDFINLLYVITAATRLIIYTICSEKIRAELIRLIGNREIPDGTIRNSSEVSENLSAARLITPMDQGRFSFHISSYQISGPSPILDKNSRFDVEETIT